MERGFETIGNATVICHDSRPVLVTDPWLVGPAYFGSWSLSHAIPDDQLQAIRSCEFVWLSHGHPDHLSVDSLQLLRGKKILLPDHYGGRIRRDLEAQDFQVHVLENRVWTTLSRNIKVLCIADYNQDAILLIDLGGVLIVNTNDASDRGWGYFVRRLVRKYKTSFLLALSGYGDADMINFFDEGGRRILPDAAQKEPPGRYIAGMTDYFGVRFFIPFSSLHKYQREDSVWANQYVTPLEDYAKGFTSKSASMLPAFIRYDCTKDDITEIRPAEQPNRSIDPTEFNDDWSIPLETDDVARLRSYLQPIHHIQKALSFINFRVAHRDNIIELSQRGFARGITFEVPRHSLMCTIAGHMFDDLLIGNFMKTTLHGTWGKEKLCRDFTPYVAKYADNGQARTEVELETYFKAYQRRAPLDSLRHRLRSYAEHCLEVPVSLFRTYLPPDSVTYKMAKRAYIEIFKRM